MKVVALSRVKNSDSVHILKFDKCAFKTNMEIVALMNYAKRNKSMKNFVFASTVNNDVDGNYSNTDNREYEK